MKQIRRWTRVLSLALCICMLAGLLPVQALADETETVQALSGDAREITKGSPIDGTDYYVTSLKNYAIAPDISEKVIMTNTAEGDSQTVANVMEMDLSNGYVKLAAGYGSLNPASEGWKLASTTEQVRLYENAYQENVVGGINASLFNITSGEPMGYLVMKGVTYKNDTSRAFVAVFDDGSVGMYDKGVTLADAEAMQSEKQGRAVKVTEAIAGWVVLVDGETVASSGSNPGYYSRSAIGMKADGTIVMLQADGTMAPRSVGYTLEEMGCMMKSLGCVYALELDEGGSSTYVSQREGESDVTMRNTPAGGSERGISTSILVISTAPSNGEFDHASLTPNNEIYTPGSQVALTAVGMDYSGALADSMPESVTWALAEDSAGMGTLSPGAVSGNQTAAVFASNGTCGTATVNLLYNGQVVGSTAVRIQDPDTLSFTSDEVNLSYGEESDLGLVASYQNEQVNLKDGDIQWSLTDDTAGTFSGNTFITTSDVQVSVSPTVTAVYGELSASTVINVGKQPTIILDGGDEDGWDYSNIGTTVTSFDGMAPDAVATYHYAGRGGVVQGSVVSDTDEEYADIVRFGHNAIRLDYDWTGLTGTDGACLGLGSYIDVPGTPTAIGVWVYVPEGVPVPWLRAQIATSPDGKTYTNAYINFNSGGADDTVRSGWQYLEADLTQYSGTRIRVNSGMLFRAMAGNAPGFGWYTTDGVLLDKSQLKGYIIIDNVSIVYGANNQDVTNPEVTAVQLINDDGTRSELENGTVVTTNEPVFFAAYDDCEETDPFATGIESAYFYLDGTYYSPGQKDNLGSTLTGVKLPNGPHSLTFYVKDGYGNVTRETRYFTVEGSNQYEQDGEIKDYTWVNLQCDPTPVVGENWQLHLMTNQLADLTQLSADISISRGYPVTGVTFAPGVTGTYSYDENQGILTVRVTGIDESAAGTEIAAIDVSIPVTAMQGNSVNVQVTKGEYSVRDALSGDTSPWTYWMGFSMPLTSYQIGAAYVISAGTLVVGMPGVITAKAGDEPAAGLDIYYNDDQKLGTTGEDGTLTTSDLTASAGTYTLYGMDADGRRSYMIRVSSYEAAGEDGAPQYIHFNVTEDAASQKNISWVSSPSHSEESAQIRLSLNEDMADAEVRKGISTLVSYSQSGVVSRVNSVYLMGLSAGTTYYFQVGDGTVWSEIRSFTTAVRKDSTKLFLLADIQEEDALTGFGNIANILKNDQYDLGIQTGDAVDNVRYYDQWEAALGLFGMEGVADTDILHVVGNHEADDDGNNAMAAKSMFNLAGDWYSVEYGNVYIAVLNHTQNRDKLEQFKQWLVEDAAATECDWKILVTHVPVYYTNPTGGGESYQAVLPEAIEAAGIDFFFAGNDHSYARTAPLTGGEVNEENGVVYYICGSTGGKSYSVVNNPDFHFEVATIDFESVYMTMETDRDSAVITAYNVNADGSVSVLDQYTKEKKRCENDEHTYLFDRETGRLRCTVCGYVSNALEEKYSGFVTEETSGRTMYLVAGVPLTGSMHYEDSFYFADDEGYAYDGEYEIGGEICIFEDGYFVAGKNAEVLAAGRAGDTVDFILYADGVFKFVGTGSTYDLDRVWNSPWYIWRSRVKKLYVDPAITALSDWAVYSCRNLTEVSFGENSQLTRIGKNTFCRCSSLKELILPEGVTYIGYDAFTDCTALTSVYLPDGVNSIMTNAFSGDQNVVLSVGYNSYAKDWAVSRGIAYVERDPVQIASGACGENLSWTLASDGLLTISGTGSMASYSGETNIPWYSYRTMITKVVIGAGVTKLTNNAFCGCINLTEAEFAENSSLTMIGGGAFKSCSSLESIQLPEGLTTISGNAFKYCRSLREVYLPNTISQIDGLAFTGLSDVTFSVAYGSYAKSWAESQGFAYVEREPAQIASGTCGDSLSWTLASDGLLTIDGTGSMATYYGETNIPWYAYREMITKVVIGAGVTKLTNNAFCGCINLTEAEFAENSSLTMIGGGAFKSCSSLESIQLPEGLTTISGNAFKYCRSLREVYLPNTISQIDGLAFTGLSDVTFSVAYGSYAKSWAESQGFAYVEREPAQIASGTCGENLSWTLGSDGLLTIDGTGSMATYYGETNIPWYAYREMITKVVIGAGVTKLTNNAFCGCINLTEAEFAENSSLTMIGGGAFKSCSSLESIQLPEGLTTISGNAFKYCRSLREVYLPNTISQIDGLAFTGLSNVTFSVAYGSYAKSWAESQGFAYVEREPAQIASGTCGENLSWTLGSDGLLTIDGTGSMATYYGETNIPWYAYREMITKVVIGAGVTKLTNNAFCGCINLTEAEFAENSSLTMIGGGAFKSCSSLESIQLPEGLTTISGNAFKYCRSLKEVSLPDTVSWIDGLAFTGLDGVVFYASSGSYAADWAAEHGFTCVVQESEAAAAETSVPETAEGTAGDVPAGTEESVTETVAEETSAAPETAGESVSAASEP